MMRVLWAIALIALSFFAKSAGAAPPCWPDLAVPLTAHAVRDKEAVRLGQVVYAASAVGLVWGYTCAAADGRWYKQLAAGPWSAFPSDWLALLDALARGTAAERAAAWDKYATATAWDERLKPDLDVVWAALPSPAPVAVWIVVADPFRADKQRLVYTVVAGKRGPATNPAQYVAAGTPCDPAVTIAELGPTYFLSVLGDPNFVARCAKP